MILPTSLLSPRQVKEIKALLWAGHLSQPEIAALYKTHQAGISRIMNGLVWEDIKWPNSDTGQIDRERHKVITTSRKRSSRYANPKQEGKPSDRTSEVLGKVHRITNSDLGTGEGHIEITNFRRGLVQRSEADRTWGWIRSTDPYHTVVRQLEGGEKNHTLKAAACFILKEVPLSEWSRKPVIAAIYQLSHFVKSTP